MWCGGADGSLLGGWLSVCGGCGSSIQLQQNTVCHFRKLSSNYNTTYELTWLRLLDILIQFFKVPHSQCFESKWLQFFNLKMEQNLVPLNESIELSYNKPHPQLNKTSHLRSFNCYSFTILHSFNLFISYSATFWVTGIFPQGCKQGDLFKLSLSITHSTTTVFNSCLLRTICPGWHHCHRFQ